MKLQTTLSTGNISKLDKFWAESIEPISIWFGWRIALFIFPIFAGMFFPPDPNSVGTPFSENLLEERLVGSWTRWDGKSYLQIAQDGYAAENSISFYPLYPHLMRLISLVIGLGNVNQFSVAVSGIIISSIASLIACILLYRLVSEEINLETAKLTVLYFLAFPVAFFLFAVYTESLFLALAIGAFYAARKNNWWLAWGLAALATITKNQGTFLVVALVFEYLQQIGWNIRRLDRRSFGLILPVLVFGGWLAENWISYGNPLQFLASLSHWKRSFSWPWQTLINSIGTVEFPLTAVFVVLLGVCLLATFQKKLRVSYLVYFILCFIQPLALPVEDSPLLSMWRYELILFPAFILLAKAGRRWPLFHYTYLGLCLPLLGVLTSRFVLWYWVA